MSRAPRSLARRLSLGVLVVGLVAVVLQGLAMQYWLNPLRDQLISGTVLQARTLQLVVAQTPPALRDAAMARLEHSQLKIRRLPPGTPPAISEDLPPPATLLIHELQTQLTGSAVAASRQGDNTIGLNIRWHQADETWEAVFQAVPPLMAVGLTLTSWVVVLALGAVMALVLTVRVITRPLERLAAQMVEQREPFGAPLVLERGASSEVATLVGAFNKLSHQVRAAQQERQQLLAGVSHDLRTPLARLRLRVETQLDSVPPAVAEQLEGDLRALQHIVEQFLHYVQGETTPRAGPLVPLVDLLHEMLAAYPRVQADIDPTVQISLPELALRRLLGNLLDNALTHGATPVVLQLKRLEAGLLLAVQDGGPGLSSDEFAQAQQPFVRLGPEHNTVGHCGLGLAIATQMARQLGGELQVRPRTEAQAFAIELRLPA
jgi:two-component system osmolarity sensor histidine kinase EnvZ